ncbi:MAG: GMC family oxidoreductase, partial [Actinomycetales bacterium]
SEAVLSARSFDPKADVTPGVAITSSFHPDEYTHIEPVRYGRGSGALSLMNMALPDRPGPGGRFRAVVRGYRVIGLRGTLKLHSPRRWAEQSVVVLVMQSLDNSITTFLKRGPFGTKLSSKQGEGEPNPDWIPVADRAAKDLAVKLGGVPGSSFGELAGVPLTAHFIGGCPIGTTIEHGVIDPYQRMFGHPGLHVADGSAITANLGVNPSLTITAQAERAMSFWPNKGETDPRPALGEAYERVDAVQPSHPAVPDSAPAALLLPLPTLRPQAAPVAEVAAQL